MCIEICINYISWWPSWIFLYIVFDISTGTINKNDILNVFATLENIQIEV